MNILIFGTGQLYHDYHLLLKSNIKVIGLVDNDSRKWGSSLDGINIYSPYEIEHLNYDAIYILNRYSYEIRKQLSSFGIPGNQIFDLEQLSRFVACSDLICQGQWLPVKKKKNILIFSIALNSTGANNALYLLVKSLKELDYCVAVMAHDGGEITLKLQQDGVPVWISKSFCMDNRFFYQAVSWSDIIIINTFWMYQLAWELKELKKPVFWWVHETGPLNYLDTAFLNSIMHSKAIRPQFVSLKILNMIKSYCKEAKWEYNMLPIGIEEKHTEISAFQNDKVVFGCIGHIGYGKGQDLFVKAIDGLTQAEKEKAEFLIVGAGLLDQETEMIANKNDCIHMVGEIPYDNIQRIYERIDVACVCSREEGLSSVVIEAGMFQRMSIISDIAGIVNYVKDKNNALLFPTEDVEALRDKMRYVLSHKDYCRIMGEKAHAIYDKYFCYSIFKENVKRYINEALCIMEY